MSAKRTEGSFTFAEVRCLDEAEGSLIFTNIYLAKISDPSAPVGHLPLAGEEAKTRGRRRMFDKNAEI